MKTRSVLFGIVLSGIVAVVGPSTALADARTVENSTYSGVDVFLAVVLDFGLQRFDRTTFEFILDVGPRTIIEGDFEPVCASRR
jgi:hypothetical protein